jgi:oxygen-independent coproporphyrinogen-3 oxidase
MRSLYIHVPFCRRKCLYCDFHSIPAPGEKQMHRYVRYLTRELEMYRDEKLATIYIGGGTPSILPAGAVETLLACIDENFDKSSLSEFTVEANPETLSGEMLELASSFGINRISIGVQSFNDAVLSRMGRSAGSGDVYRALDLLRKHGAANVNMDLMLGISEPHLFLEDLREAIAWDPAHMSVYILGVSEQTPLFDMIGKGLFSELGAEEQEHLYRKAERMLRNAGYLRYEISNFAKPGFESRHNLRYWHGCEYIGAGPTAVSTVGTARSTNCRLLTDYYAMLDRGKRPVASIEQLTPRKIMLERVMLMLRTETGLPFEELKRMAGRISGNGGGGEISRAGNPPLMDFILMLQRRGLAVPSEKNLMLTTRGFLRSNHIIARIWEYLDN